MKYLAVVTVEELTFRTDLGNHVIFVLDGAEIIVWPKSDRRHGRLYWAAYRLPAKEFPDEWDTQQMLGTAYFNQHYARAEINNDTFAIKEQI